MTPLKKLFGLLFCLTLFAACESAPEKEEEEFEAKSGSTITTKEITYQSGDTTMNGYLAMPAGAGPFPGVLVVHEWWGQTDYPRQRARMLAQAGYAAFAVDMYGEGKTANHPDDAKAFSAKVMEDMDKAEENFRVALATLKAQEGVDASNTAALGYCFGGAVVLEMARRGVNLNMVASYHGNLTPIVKNDIPEKMKTRVLIFNGAADTFVTSEAISQTRAKLKAANVRYKFINYKGAKHGFTNPMATAKGEQFKLPLAYDERADQKSWDETLKAFNIVFK